MTHRAWLQSCGSSLYGGGGIEDKGARLGAKRRQSKKGRNNGPLRCATDIHKGAARRSAT